MVQYERTSGMEVDMLRPLVSYNMSFINQLEEKFQRQLASKNEQNRSKYYNALALEWINKCSSYVQLMKVIINEGGKKDYLESSPEILYNSFTIVYLICELKIGGNADLMKYIGKEYHDYVQIIKTNLVAFKRIPEYQSALSHLTSIIDECHIHETDQEAKNRNKHIRKSHKSSHLNEYYDDSLTEDTAINKDDLVMEGSKDDRDALYGPSGDSISKRDSVGSKSIPITKDHEHKQYSTVDELLLDMKAKYLFSEIMIIISISYPGKYIIPRTMPRGTYIVNIDPIVLKGVHRFAELENEYPFLKNFGKFENVVFFNPDDTNPNHIEDCNNSLRNFSHLIRSAASDMRLTIKVIELQKAGERVLFMKRHRDISGSLENVKISNPAIPEDQKQNGPSHYRRGSSVSPVRSNQPLNESFHSLVNDSREVSRVLDKTNQLSSHSYSYNSSTLDPSKYSSSPQRIYSRPALSIPMQSASTDSLLKSKVQDTSRPPIPNAPNLISSVANVPQRHPQSNLPIPPPIQSRVSSTTSQMDPTNTAFGLHNYQNTCYINSMIQCLFNISSFRAFFVKGGFSGMLRRKYGESHLSICIEISNLFKQCVLSDQRVIQPDGFLRLCSRLRPDLNIPIEQQDTSQFFYFLTDRLHEELRLLPTKENIDKYSFRDPGSNLFEGFCANSDYLKWHTKMLEDEGASPISKWFQIEMETSLRCHRCGFESKKYEHSSMLTLNFMHISHMHSNSSVHLGQMIQNSLGNEELSEAKGNAWNCPKCEKYKKLIQDFNDSAKELDLRMECSTDPGSPAKSQRKMKFGIFKRGQEKMKDPKTEPSSDPSYNLDGVYDTEMKKMYEEAETAKYILSQPNVSSKTTRFVALPPILAIYLARTDANQNKIRTPVVSPKSLILDIDLQKNGTAEVGSVALKCRYQLTGWISHIGANSEHGHYTAYIQKNRRWIHCDDEYLSPAEFIDYNDKEVSDSNSYILFYVAT